MEPVAYSERLFGCRVSGARRGRGSTEGASAICSARRRSSSPRRRSRRGRRRGSSRARAAHEDLTRRPGPRLDEQWRSNEQWLACIFERQWTRLLLINRDQLQRVPSFS
ncbi:hypothetical protein K523DRAFT_144737 [Schizophyllum commune Tattone D]|nr:hypothetical protein K523DRAFT_144737 [Schizophyllum commune Tattone D]